MGCAPSGWNDKPEFGSNTRLDMITRLRFCAGIGTSTQQCHTDTTNIARSVRTLCVCANTVGKRVHAQSTRRPAHLVKPPAACRITVDVVAMAGSSDVVLWKGTLPKLARGKQSAFDRAPGTCSVCEISGLSYYTYTRSYVDAVYHI